jgi:Na+-translocating ferredoxin:NAD+ oxidoreductase RnfD subunit
MTLTHLEIYVLIYFSGYEDIVLYALLIMSECTPKVTVECVKERKCRTVEATVGVCRCA